MTIWKPATPDQVSTALRLSMNEQELRRRIARLKAEIASAQPHPDPAAVEGEGSGDAE
jgi:hypothetical protein